jgi:hypothetical protein
MKVGNPTELVNAGHHSSSSTLKGKPLNVWDLKVDSQQILSFYMGKNTPERKDYIMENLVVTVEE